MSGESTPRATASAVAFERAFGDAAVCNRCAKRAAGYRVIATFLHDTVAVRAYCPECYDVAIAGEYHARGDGVVLDYSGFAERFGAAGPPPPPCTPADRFLAGLIRDPAVEFLAPPSESLARRTRSMPYRIRLELRIEGASRPAELSLTPEGRATVLDADPTTRERLKALLG